MCNVGFRPTFENSNKKTIEVNIFSDLEMDLYGNKIKIIFNTFIRKEIQFSSENELITQLQHDKEYCLTI